MKEAELVKSIRLKAPVVLGPPGSIARRDWVTGPGVSCLLTEVGLVVLEVDAEGLRYRKVWALASGDVEVELTPLSLAEVESPVAPEAPEAEEAPKRRGRPPKAQAQG